MLHFLIQKLFIQNVEMTDPCNLRQNVYIGLYAFKQLFNASLIRSQQLKHQSNV